MPSSLVFQLAVLFITDTDFYYGIQAAVGA
jgi:hypothetical protein